MIKSPRAKYHVDIKKSGNYICKTCLQSYILEENYSQKCVVTLINEQIYTQEKYTMNTMQ